jgi:hypothetical protein
MIQIPDPNGSDQPGLTSESGNRFGRKFRIVRAARSAITFGSCAPHPAHDRPSEPKAGLPGTSEGKKMNSSPVNGLNAIGKLMAVLRRHLRPEPLGRKTQSFQGGPMKNELMTITMEEPYTVVACGKSSADSATVGAVGRVLGYTWVEQSFAADVLNRFAWSYPAEPSAVQAAEAVPIDAFFDRDAA